MWNVGRGRGMELHVYNNVQYDQYLYKVRPADYQCLVRDLRFRLSGNPNQPPPATPTS